MELSQLLLLSVLLRSNSRCHRLAVPFANEAPERYWEEEVEHRALALPGRQQDPG